MASVKFENITINYGKKNIIKNLSMDIRENEIMGLVGPSGCGKTTLIRALCGFIKPVTGNIYLNDHLVYSQEKRINIPPEKRGIGVVFQDYAVWPHLSVWENVVYPMKKHKVPKDEIQKRATYALEQVRMTGYERHMPSQLSGGQQQRVAIARALVSSDELIILDEPITNLDAKLREKMIIEIQMIQKKIGTTIIYITHDQETALKLCNRISIMEPDGTLVQIGTGEEITKTPKNRFVFTFIGVTNFIPIIEKNGSWYFNVDDEIEFSHNMPAGYLKGKKNVMGIRPTDIMFDESSKIKGKIAHSVFLGDQYDYFVQLGSKELRIQRNSFDIASGREYNEGDIVGLSFLHPYYFEDTKEASL
ncbi:MAG TPA: ABC transporter ATP-binding protein [Clostridiaceae bacterium]|nr:ABC transporter ATP-binding protein [Clostridiaceae bacterium]